MGLLKGTVFKGVIASKASSNDKAYLGNSGELPICQAKLGVNLQECLAARCKLRLSYKMNNYIKPK